MNIIHQFAGVLGLLILKNDADTATVIAFKDAEDARGVVADQIIWLRNPNPDIRKAVRECLRYSKMPTESFLCHHAQ